MATLNSIPVELLLRIQGSLGQFELLRLSSVDSRLRSIAIQEGKIFESIFCSARKANISDSALLVAKKYGRFFRELHLAVELPVCYGGCSDACSAEQDGNEWVPEDEAKELAESTVELLRGRDDMLPNLRHISVRFPDNDDFGPEHDYIYCEDPAHHLQRLVTKNSSMTNAVMDVLIHGSLLYNKQGMELAIHNMPPLYFRPEKFDNDWDFFSAPKGKWQDILRVLEAFHLSMFGEHWDLWSSYINCDYTLLLGDLGPNFFDHLESAKRVSFHGSPNVPITNEYMPLAAQCMPRLEELEIGNILMDEVFLQLIWELGKRDPPMPLKLKLVNVAAAAEGEHPWSDIFESLIDSEVEFSEFSVQFREASIDLGHHWIEDERDMAAGEALLAAEPDRLIFPYGGIADKYGCYYGDERANLEALLAGDDEHAYRRFLDKVAGLLDHNNQGLERSVEQA